jgi:hypothetical protein
MLEIGDEQKHFEIIFNSSFFFVVLFIPPSLPPSLFLPS